MAISVVSRTARGINGDAVSFSIAMPATVSAGDLLIVEWQTFVGGDDPITPVSAPSGWTLISIQGGANFAPASGLIAKKADGTEGGTNVVQSFGVDGTCRGMAIQIYRITGWKDSGNLTNDVKAAASSIAAFGSVDPPNLTTGFGNVATLWLASVGYSDSSSVTVTGYPSGYGNGAFNLNSSGIFEMIGGAYKVATASSDNPGAFTLNEGGNDSIVRTYAVQQSGAVLNAAGTISGSASASCSAQRTAYGAAGASANSTATLVGSKNMFAAGTITGEAIASGVAAFIALGIGIISATVSVTGNATRIGELVFRDIHEGISILKNRHGVSQNRGQHADSKND